MAGWDSLWAAPGREMHEARDKGHPKNVMNVCQEELW